MLSNHWKQNLGSTKATLYLPFKMNNKAITFTTLLRKSESRSICEIFWLFLGPEKTTPSKDQTHYALSIFKRMVQN